MSSSILVERGLGLHEEGSEQSSIASWLSWLHDVDKKPLSTGSCFIFTPSPDGFTDKMVDNNAVVVSEVRGVVGMP